MTKAFNENYQLHSWVIHFDEANTKWQQMIKDVYTLNKESTFSRFVAFNAIRQDSNYKSFLAG